MAVLDGNVDSFQKLSNFIDCITDMEDQVTLGDYYNNANNPIKSSNLVIIACKYSKVKILEYLLDSKILNNLSVGIERPTILPYDEDEECHNAFYYAIRSGNLQLLDILINKWPSNYFAANLGELDKILSIAYEELQLKNVLLSNKMEIFVENKLLNFRFFSNTSDQGQSFTSDLKNTRKRIEFIFQNINLLTTEYSNIEKVDKKFLFIIKFIAQNFHVLKRQLKSTYDRLPWEEMEFYLISFVSSYTKRQEINLFYNANLSKDKILNHLQNFAEKFEDEKYFIEGGNISQFVEIPKLKREKVIAGIISNSPQFEELYNDYQQIRDIYSLEKINDNIKLALSTDPKEREGQLIITRVLQVIGEYLKNTLESPKLSNTTSELFLLSLPKNTRDVVIDLRNSLSHSYSFSKRTEIEENTDVNFFIGIQNDIKKVDDVITDILYHYKIKMIRILLKKIVSTENLDEIKEVATLFSNVTLDKTITGNFQMIEHEKLEKQIQKLIDNITKKTDYEKELFNKINNIINFAKTKSEKITADYYTELLLLQSLCANLNYKHVGHNNIRVIKFYANKTLENFDSKPESHNLKEIVEILMKIFHSVTRRQHDHLDEVKRLIYEIFNTAEFGIDNIKWIEALRDELNEKGSSIRMQNQKTNYSITKKQHIKQLALKLSELKRILINNGLSDELIEKFPFYKKNKKLKVVIEMLVLDIMSILSSLKIYLANNLFFVDDNAPLLTGKCLRNHLAHDNVLLDVLLSDPSVAVILNAKKLTENNIMDGKKKIGKLVSDNPSKLKDKFNQDLVIITNQESMFVALEEGNFVDLKSYLRKGVDIHARSINAWTTLHFAAKGPSLEVVKFLLDQNVVANAKDVDGQNPLHIAAAHGRKNIVEFFVKKTNLYVDDRDNSGKTPLHIAAQNGQKDTVEILLKNNASTNIQDRLGCPPLHHAIRNNHIDVAKILLKKQVDVDINDTMGGFTSLHIAAEGGHFEIVNFLLKNNANVNARTDQENTPLHSAAINGHLEVVNALILKGANVNARVLDGCTALHHALERGHEEIANILLKCGTNVNAFDKIYNNTPLHYAAKDGYERIVKSLLKSKADASVTTVEGLTPLHLAVESGHLEIVTALLQHGVNIHAKGKNGATSLHYAAENGHKDIAELLIKNKAEVNAKANNNFTPLHTAALNGQKDVIALLIKNKAEVNTQGIKGSTPLHAAAMHGSKDVIDLLIKNKAKINARTNDGVTPLYEAAVNGHKDAIALLIKNKAEINTRANYSFTPLCAAVMGGHKDIVKLLIKNKASVNAGCIEDIAPLHFAVEAGHKEVIEILIANGANVNATNKSRTPLSCAVIHNSKEIVEVLIANGANVNAEHDESFMLAVLAGYRDIIEILLKNKASINLKYPENATLLHLAAKRGYKEIVNTLVIRGAEIDALTINNVTPLCFAAQKGYKQTVEVLIANGANVNIKTNENGSPLHIAAISGHSNVVKVLLNNEANVNIKDNKNRTPVELAVAYSRLEVVKMLLQCKKVDINAKCNDDWTILHIASQESNLEIVKYLINEGSDINAKNASGSKPLHIAAREGHKDTVEHFLNNGLSINDLSTIGQTVLHYASINGHLEVVKYLVTEGADVNAKDANGVTPTHIAATFGYKDVIEVLLKNGAVYNAVDKFYRKPLDVTKDKNVINLLASTKKLFDAVKCNVSSEVEDYIKAGAFVNAKNADNGTPLHYAAWKGYEKVVNILLQNKANPNAVDNKGFTPLHYAAKFSHIKTVKALLASGAVYNALSDSDKMPLDFTADKSITNLFKLLIESFKNIKNGNSKVINELNRINDLDTIKAIMGACNRDNRTLVVAAVHSKFAELEQLKQISQGDLSTQINTALAFCDQGNYQISLRLLNSAFEKRKAILGPDNPGTLDIQTNIAKVLYKQGAYQEALNMLEDIFKKQKEMLGLDDKDTLNTRSVIALLLHRQNKNGEAFNIYQEVYQKQKEILGPNHFDTLNTEFHMAMVLDKQGKYEEALNINRTVFEKRKCTLGANNPITVSVQNNIAMVLANQDKHEEALKIYKEVLEKKKIILGIHHADTLRTLTSIAGIIFKQNKYNEALKAYREVLNIQKKVLGQNHPETLNTQYNLANVLFVQGKGISALKAYRECFDHRKAVFGPNHPSVLNILKYEEVFNSALKLQGTEASDIHRYLQKDLNIATSNGDIQTVKRLLKDGTDVNDNDLEGRTPLHYAVSNGYIDIVNILLKNGADVTQITNKGNTPLHTATSKSYKEIVEVLLQHINYDKLHGFINAKTVSAGTTSLHVAAKSGYLEVAKSLLKHGATYNIQNKEGKTPIDLSKDRKVFNLLKLIEDLFRDIKNGNVEIMSKLKEVKLDEFLAITNARNNQGNTLLQVAIVNKHKNIVSKLLEMLKKPNLN